MRKNLWTKKEDELIIKLLEEGKNYSSFPQYFPNRSLDAIKIRARLYKKNKLPSMIWTEDKLNYLLENHNSLTYKEMSKKLDIKYQTLYSKCKELNIKCVSYIHTWTEDEDKYLKENYLRMTYSQIARKMNLSTESVQQHAIEIGLSKTPTAWTDEEILILKKHYSKSDEKTLCRLINKSYLSIYAKARKLGLEKEDVSIYQKEFIRNNYMQKTDSEISDILKLHIDRVASLRKELGLLKVGNEIKGPTSIEKMVMKILNEADIAYLYSQQLKNFRPDFLIEGTNKVIEVNGDYFHCNPMLYPNGPKDANQIRHIVQDYYKKCFYISNNYDVLYVWEYDLVNNFENIKKKIKKFINAV